MQTYDPAPFIPTLGVVWRLVPGFDYRSAVIGGVTVSRVVKSRFKADKADVEVVMIHDLDQFNPLIKVVGEVGLAKRYDDLERFTREQCALLHRHTASGTNVDILPFAIVAVERSACDA